LVEEDNSRTPEDHKKKRRREKEEEEEVKLRTPCNNTTPNIQNIATALSSLKRHKRVIFVAPQF
jgi:hypothetical protein